MNNIIDKTYTDHALMDNIIYNCKIILKDIVIKNDVLANYYESENSVKNYEYLNIIKRGKMTNKFFPYSKKYFDAYTNYTGNILYNSDISRILSTDNEEFINNNFPDLLDFSINYFLNNYVEENDYYRTYIGEPPYNTGDKYYVYISTNDLPDDISYYYKDILNLNLDFTPVHKLPNKFINILYSIGIIDSLRKKYTGTFYKYLQFMGDRSLDLYTIRSAARWDILYITSKANVDITDKFKELYGINRSIYLKHTYQDAFAFNNDYYDQMMIVMVLCQTLNDMIVNTPEWYINRDVFDLRSVQYFLDSYGVKFFEEIPLRYQKRIVKNINKLIKYKSSEKNFDDIIDIFGKDNINIWKYYLHKKSPKYKDIDRLEFIKTKIGDSYDNYIKNNIHRIPYNNITLEDKYWDGDESHDYIRKRHIDRDFSIEGTKYMSMDYDVNITDYKNQMVYFLGTLLSSNLSSDIKVKIPEINDNSTFDLSNLFLLLFMLTNRYYGFDNNAKFPEDNQYNKDRVHKKYKFRKFANIDGGPHWNFNLADGGGAVDRISYELSDGYGADANLKHEDDGIYGDVFPLYDDGTVKINDNFITTIEVDNFKTCDGWTSANDNQNFDGKLPEPKDTKHAMLDGGSPFEEKEDIIVVDYNGEDIAIYDDHRFDIDGRYFNTPNDYYMTGSVHYNIEYVGLGASDELQAPLSIDGGDLRINGLMKFGAEEFYNWMHWQYPEIFIDKNNTRVYGFNLKADLDSISKIISRRHSRFQFDNGFTLSDFGVDKFTVPNETITSIKDLVNLYDTNMKCLSKLKNKMSYKYDNRDDYRLAQYVYEQLFTTEFDYVFYNTNDPDNLETLDTILRSRDYILYKEYKALINENDINIKKANIRNILNTIIDSLDYYINGNGIEYIFTFAPIESFYSILKYIYLMINFFKSYKVYFLDPYLTYNTNDAQENNSFAMDTIAEKRIDYWKADRYQDDNHDTIKILVQFDKDIYTNISNIVNIYGYYVPDSDENDYSETIYDGGNVASSVDDTLLLSITGGNNNSEDIDKNKYYQISGGKRSGIWNSLYLYNGGGASNIDTDLDKSEFVVYADGKGSVGDEIENNRLYYPYGANRSDGQFANEMEVRRLSTVTKVISTAYTMRILVSLSYNISEYNKDETNPAMIDRDDWVDVRDLNSTVNNDYFNISSKDNDILYANGNLINHYEIAYNGPDNLYTTVPCKHIDIDKLEADAAYINAKFDNYFIEKEIKNMIDSAIKEFRDINFNYALWGKF